MKVIVSFPLLPPQRAARWTRTAWVRPMPRIQPTALRGARLQSCCCACCTWPPGDRPSTDTVDCGASSASQGPEVQSQDHPCSTISLEISTNKMPSQILFTLNPCCCDISVSVKTERELSFVIGYFYPDPGAEES